MRDLEGADEGPAADKRGPLWQWSKEAVVLGVTLAGEGDFRLADKGFFGIEDGVGRTAEVEKKERMVCCFFAEPRFGVGRFCLGVFFIVLEGGKRVDERDWSRFK